MANSNRKLLEEAMAAIDALRQRRARVHSITNTVAQNITANCLLACGAVPAMTINPAEMETFVGAADALHINLGTLDEARITAIRSAVGVAGNIPIPITLDPVMAERSALRLELARELLPHTYILKANAAEIDALDTGSNRSMCVVATGCVDTIVSGGQTVRVENGDPMLARITATGCALGAILAALSTVAPASLTASLAGTLWFSVAGEVAAEKSAGPGTFSPHLLDALFQLTTDEIMDRARLA